MAEYAFTVQFDRSPAVASSQALTERPVSRLTMMMAFSRDLPWVPLR